MFLMHRVSPGGVPFHVLNRAVGRRTFFESATDYEGFVETGAETLRIRRMRICGCCVMPNHWHFVLWPEHDGELAGVRASVTRGRPYGDDA